MERIGRFRRLGLIARNTLAFEVELRPGTSPVFIPGQYVYLEWKDPASDVRSGDGRNFSVASPPKDLPVLSFATRLTGSPFKKSLLSLPEGSPMFVSGTYGEFCLPVCLGERRNESWDAPVALIAGGIGITPFRSMLLHAIDLCQSLSFFLFTMNPSPEDIPFRLELESLSETHKNLFLCQHVLQSGVSLPPEVNLGPLTPDKIFGIMGQKALKGSYFVSGPPSLVTSFRTALLGAGVLPEQIHTDLFFGYS